jgi:hypothetical protein|tara:strand:- start:102 stop:335 length:234 start_codon:yes stop_codon:yes gene_type:complete
MLKANTNFIIRKYPNWSCSAQTKTRNTIYYTHLTRKEAMQRYNSAILNNKDNKYFICLYKYTGDHDQFLKRLKRSYL